MKLDLFIEKNKYGYWVVVSEYGRTMSDGTKADAIKFHKEYIKKNYIIFD